MSEQSSLVVVSRAFVMLVCLICIPLAALFGSSIPAVVKAIQAGRWPTLAELKGPMNPASNPLGDAPRYAAPASESTPTLSMMTPSDPRYQSMSNNPPPAATNWANGNGDHNPSQVIPASFDRPVDSGHAGPGEVSNGSDGHGRLTPVPPDGQALLSLDHGGGPAVSDAPAGTGAKGQSSTSNTPSASGSRDPYTQVQDRLRQLGATYYLLEAWGDQKREFRFYCRMAIGGNPQFTQAFQAIDIDPVRAMSLVLQQVETWRSGRS